MTTTHRWFHLLEDDTDDSPETVEPGAAFIQPDGTVLTQPDGTVLTQGT